MANRSWSNSRIYSGSVEPVLINCNFVVDPANGNGLGIRNLKGAYVNNVFMHTSAPLAGSGNPNPEAGVIVVQLSDNYNRYLAGFSGQVSPLSGSSLSISGSSLTVGHPYVITSVGTSTAADLAAIGVPAGVVANISSGAISGIGVSFIAAATGSGSGSGTVQAPSVSGIDHIEIIGDPNQSSGPNPTSNQGFGAQFIMQCLASGSLATPATGSVIELSFLLSNSSVLVGGQ